MNEEKFLLTRSSLLSRLKDEEDQSSWLEFFNSYWKMIYNVSRKSGLSHEDAQDVVQDSILTVVRRIKKFKYDREKGSFKGWLKVITRSRILDHWRKQKRRPAEQNSGPQANNQEEIIESIPDSRGFELERIWDQEWQNNVHAIALDRVRQIVSAKQFQIFDCYVLKEWSVNDIKIKLGFSSGQIYMAKYRVGKLLKHELEQLLKEEN